MASQDELGARVRQQLENLVPIVKRSLPRRSPRRRSEVVVECHDAERSVTCTLQFRRGADKLRALERTLLLAPRAHRVEADDSELLGLKLGLCDAENAIPLGESRRKSRGQRVRIVVISGHREHGKVELVEQRARSLELARRPRCPRSRVATRRSGLSRSRSHGVPRRAPTSRGAQDEDLKCGRSAGPLPRQATSRLPAPRARCADHGLRRARSAPASSSPQRWSAGDG
jgi:hypothetical protein